jgi:hypothetical protein
MFDNVDLYKPDLIIRCADLKESSEIYPMMKKLNARDYAYGFAYLPHDELRVQYLKIGKSSPATDRISKVLGERIVRQLCHLQGWPQSNKAISNNGFDFMMNLQNLVAAGKMSARALDKNNIVLGVWNTDSMFRTCKVDATPAEQAAWLEAKLCELYKNDFKLVLPPLNKMDPANGSILQKTWVNRDITSSVFSFE